MLNIQEKMFAAPFSDVRDGFIARARLESGRIADARLWMVNMGFEEVEPEPEQIITRDGREIILAHGKSWALRPDVHAERLAAAFDAARHREPPTSESQAGHDARESIATVICPQMIEGRPCGGSLNRRGVCPSCVTGKMGYRYRYTCESCGCDIVTREELR